MASKIVKQDTVIVTAGKDKNKTGKVLSVVKKSNKAVVEGVNIFKKHQKPSKKYPQGGIIDVTLPMSISNLMVVCQACNKPTRIRFKNSAKDKRRVCVKCGEVINAS